MYVSFFVPSLALLSSVSTAWASPLARRDQCECACTAGNAKDTFLRKLLEASPEYGNFQHSASQGPLRVGIVGAGAAGLYAGMLLESLGIDYEILEGSDRVGGRIFTYRFDEAAWDASKPDEPDYYNYYVRTSCWYVYRKLTGCRMWEQCDSLACHGWIVLLAVRITPLSPT